MHPLRKLHIETRMIVRHTST